MISELVLYSLWLYQSLKMDCQKMSTMLDIFSSAKEVYDASKEAYTEVASHVLSPKEINALCSKNLLEAEKLAHTVKQLGGRIVLINDGEYPDRLRQIIDPPQVLFVIGHLPLENQLTMAVVGSRSATYYGMNQAERLSRTLAMQGVSIVSGMARGIDASAHKGALEAGGHTVGVLGCGLDVVYPYDTKELRQKAEKSGCIITEMLPGMVPLPHVFHRRNRLMTGLSHGVLIVEAGAKSGALISATLAMEQGREVFSVPGNIDVNSSVGCNRLIQQGAKLVSCPEDILEEFEFLGMHIEKATDAKSQAPSFFSKAQADIDAVLSQTPITLEALCDTLPYPPQVVSATLMQMELMGWIRQLPGKCFVKVIP